MAQKKYFVRIPVPGGVRQANVTHVEADVSRLDLSVITQLWERGDPSRGESPFRLARGVEGLVRVNSVDVSTLLETLHDIAGQCREMLREHGEAGEKVGKLLAIEGSLKRLITSLAEHRPASADEALRDGLYELMSTSDELVKELETITTTASGMEVAVNHLEQTAVRKDEIAGQLYLEWAKAADDLIESTTELEVLERKLQDLRSDVTRFRRQWAELVSPENETLSTAAEFLDGDDSFIIQAYAYLRDEGERSEIEAAIAAAREHIASVRAAELKARQLWQATRTRVNSELAANRAHVRDLCDKLIEATKCFGEYRVRFPEGTARPFEVRDALITQERYEQAETVLTNARWSPWGAKNRLEGLLASLLGCADEQPELPAELVARLGSAEKYIGQIGELWQEQTGQPAPSALPENDSEELEIAEERGTLLAPVAAQAQPTIVIQTRADELYELVICVGLVLTRPATPLSGSNVYSMLHVIHQLDRCNRQEVETYRAALEQRTSAPTECEKLFPEQSAVGRQRESSARWIQYQIARCRQPSLKLTHGAFQMATELLRKHGLTEQAIKEASARKREQQLRDYEAWKLRRKR